MSKKTLLLIIALFFVVTGLLLLATSASKKPRVVTNIQPLPTAAPANTMLSFSPDPGVATNPTATNTISVLIDTQDEVTAVQLELAFDPKELTIIDVSPAKTTTTNPDAAPFFANPTVFTKKIDQRGGRITYVLALSGTEPAKTGKGALATISYRLNANVQQAKLSFSSNPATLVTASGVSTSVLKETKDTTISLQSTQPTR